MAGRLYHQTLWCSQQDMEGWVAVDDSPSVLSSPIDLWDWTFSLGAGRYHSGSWASYTPPALPRYGKTGHKQGSLRCSCVWPEFLRRHPSKSEKAYKFGVEKVQRQAFGGISQYRFLGLKQNIFTRASAGVSLLNMAYTPCYCFIIMYNWQ